MIFSAYRMNFKDSEYRSMGEPTPSGWSFSPLPWPGLSSSTSSQKNGLQLKLICIKEANYVSKPEPSSTVRKSKILSRIMKHQLLENRKGRGRSKKPHPRNSSNIHEDQGKKFQHRTPWAQLFGRTLSAKERYEKGIRSIAPCSHDFGFPSLYYLWCLCCD